MKKVKLTIEIEFDEHLSVNGERQVARNVAEALRDQVDHAGLAPEDSEAVTTNFTISIENEFSLTETIGIGGWTSKEKIYKS